MDAENNKTKNDPQRSAPFSASTSDLRGFFVEEDMRICSIPGCDNKYYGKDYCNKHYKRFKKYGNPLCNKKETHSMSQTAEYDAWFNMKVRCYNKKHKSYHRYGGRGIVVCERWRDDFIFFYQDMGLKPFPKAQLDRIDNDGNYEPSNCRWTTHARNGQNQVTTKLTIEKAMEIRKIYSIGNILQKELAGKYGVHKNTIRAVVSNRTWKTINLGG